MPWRQVVEKFPYEAPEKSWEHMLSITQWCDLEFGANDWYLGATHWAIRPRFLRDEDLKIYLLVWG